MIDNLDNYCQTSCVLSVCEEHDPSNLDLPPLRGVDLDICHANRTTAEGLISFMSGNATGLYKMAYLPFVEEVVVNVIDLGLTLNLLV